MATSKQVSALIREHKKVEAAGLPGLPNATPAFLDTLSNAEVDAAFQKLNCIPATDAQVSFLISILGGLDKLPDEVAEFVRGLTKFDANANIKKLQRDYSAQRAFIIEHTNTPAPRMLWDLLPYELENVFERCYSQVEELDRRLLSSSIPDEHRDRLIQSWEKFKNNHRVRTLAEVAAAPELAYIEASEPSLVEFADIEL